MCAARRDKPLWECPDAAGLWLVEEVYTKVLEMGGSSGNIYSPSSSNLGAANSSYNALAGDSSALSGYLPQTLGQSNSAVSSYLSNPMRPAPRPAPTMRRPMAAHSLPRSRRAMLPRLARWLACTGRRSAASPASLAPIFRRCSRSPRPRRRARLTRTSIYSRQQRRWWDRSTPARP